MVIELSPAVRSEIDDPLTEILRQNGSSRTRSKGSTTTESRSPVKRSPPLDPAPVI
jgi:hypothetical protein